MSLNTNLDRDTDRTFTVGGRIVVGSIAALFLVVGCGGWAALANLSGAVIASGAVKVDRNLKAIQHRDGGIVSEIAVREGDFVRAGQTLLRLDDVQTRAELSIIRSQITELAARRARLVAERDGHAELTFPAGFESSSREAAQVAEAEETLFHSRLTDRIGQKQQLAMRIAQIEKEVIGLEAQRVAKIDEIRLVEAENDKIRKLLAKGLVESTRLYTGERDAARLIGSRGEVEAGIARASATASEIRLQIIAIDQNARTEAQRELNELDAKLSELNDRRIAVEDRLARTDIRAPVSGYVNELSVHTIGGVVTPAERLITIVPDTAALRIEAKLSPSDIDQVRVGQAARLRFSAFNQRTTPEIPGRVAFVSPATTRDTVTGEHYYLADIAIAPGDLRKLGDNKLLPGMPVEVYVSTDERTALSYLTKPFMDQVSKAFREQ